jgi:hypothetical protein
MENKGSKGKYFYHEHLFFCSLELAMEIIGGKWKSMIIYFFERWCYAFVRIATPAQRYFESNVYIGCKRIGT